MLAVIRARSECPTILFAPGFKLSASTLNTPWHINESEVVTILVGYKLAILVWPILLYRLHFTQTSTDFTWFILGWLCVFLGIELDIASSEATRTEPFN
jgi:hypothetical protein